jgi:hypothetical protein
MDSDFRYRGLAIYPHERIIGDDAVIRCGGELYVSPGLFNRIANRNTEEACDWIGQLAIFDMLELPDRRFLIGVSPYGIAVLSPPTPAETPPE